MDCWQWMGAHTGDGYGQIQVDGKMRVAHRVAWQMLRGDIPDGLQADHLCRNRNCVNPSHVDLVTVRENVRRQDHSKAIAFLKARAAAATHCRAGLHEWSEETIYRGSRGERRCRPCRHEYRQVRQSTMPKS